MGRQKGAPCRREEREGRRPAGGAEGGGGIDLKVRNVSQSVSSRLHLSRNNPCRLTCPSHVPIGVCGDVGLGLLGVIEMEEVTP